MIYILLAYATRVIKPKGYEDLYLTQKCDKLTLAPANLPGFENQKVFIYNRMIYFDLNGKKYTLGMKSNDITVRLIENTIKKVSFISKKKMVDFFGLDKQESKPEMKENKVNNEYIDTNEKFRVGSSVPKNLNENFFKRRVPVNEEEKRKIVVKEEENIEKKEKLIPKKETHHFIESDSNLFEQEDLAIKNVQIDEKNSEYFQLKSENTCVTLFENKFIFAPCIKNASQYFSAVQIDEIIKKQEIKKDTSVNLPLKNISKPVNILKENNKDTSLKPSSFSEKGMIKENELKEPKPFTSFSVVKDDSMLNDKKKDSLLLTSKNEDGNSPAELLDRLKHTLEETNLGDF